jgi:hypothetical protein
MVVSRKQMNPKKPSQMGGSRKQFGASSTMKKPEQMGGSRKTKKHGEVMHEVCVACYRNGHKGKVAIQDVRKESFKGKGKLTRYRLVGKCEHGHKWFRFAKSD